MTTFSCQVIIWTLCLIYNSEANDNCLLPTTVDDAIAYANMIIEDNSSYSVEPEHFIGHWYYLGTTYEFYGIFVGPPNYLVYSTAGTVEQKISPLHPDLVAAGFRRPFLQECLVDTTLEPSSSPSATPTNIPTNIPSSMPTTETKPPMTIVTESPTEIPLTAAPSGGPTINTSVIPKPPSSRITAKPSYSPTFVSSTSSTTTTQGQTQGQTTTQGQTIIQKQTMAPTNPTTHSEMPLTTQQSNSSGSTLITDEENSVSMSIGIILLGLLAIFIIIFFAKKQLRKKEPATVVNGDSTPSTSHFQPLYSMPQKQKGGIDVLYETIDDCLGEHPSRQYEKAVTNNPAYIDRTQTESEYDIADFPLQKNRDYDMSVFSIDDIYDSATTSEGQYDTATMMSEAKYDKATTSDGQYDTATMMSEAQYDKATTSEGKYDNVNKRGEKAQYDTAAMNDGHYEKVNKNNHDYRNIVEINYESGI